MLTAPMPAMPAMPIWSAVDLGNCRTAFLESIDLARIPVPAARAIRSELAGRRNES